VKPVTEVSRKSEDAVICLLGVASQLLFDFGLAASEAIEENFQSEDFHEGGILEVSVCDATIDDDALEIVFNCGVRAVGDLLLRALLRFVHCEDVGVEDALESLSVLLS
jgi:hypothetical protein